jgi:phosphatidylglycerol:prolipoprotein diacylglycerol transferase
MLNYPNINPIALAIGPLEIRWYSLAYIAGIFLGWLYAKQMNKRAKFATAIQFENVITWVVIGIVAGGRIGYCLFYNTTYFLSNPHEILYIWQGGMSFHGGMTGCILSMYIYCRLNKIAFFPFMDAAAAVAGIGIFFGRLANFINGELYGRVTDSSIAMIFPNSDGQPRYPSQLFEAFGEGFMMVVILSILYWVFNAWRRPRLICGVFLIWYAFVRITLEQFREPDEQLGFFLGHYTMGQILSVPMVLLGIYLIFRALREPKKPNN